MRRPRSGFGGPLAAVASCLIAGLAATTARAIEPELTLTGFARTRYFYFDGTPIDRRRGGTDTEFADYRATFDPTLSFGPSLRLRGRLDVLDNVVLGNNTDTANVLSGLSRAVSNFEFTGDTDFPNRLEEIDDIQIERLWAEVSTPVGLLSVGRQPSDFGLGILANSGSRLEVGPEGTGPTAGDSVDRIRFTTDIARALDWEEGQWIAALAYDRAIENQVTFDADDVHQIILATISTTGSMAPRVVGDRELGAYLVWATGDRWDTDVLLADGYFHLAFGSWFLEGEGVIGTGRTRRGGLIPGESKDTAEDDLVEGLSEDFVESLNGSLALEDAADFARNGFPEYLQTFIATELFDTGFSERTSLAIAERGVAAGLPLIYDEMIDVFVYGGVLRFGYEADAFRLTAEVGHASPPGSDDFVAVRVGPEGSENDAIDAAIVDAVDDAVGERAFTGHDFHAYPFDSEYDVALILYELAGPINPASGNPGVFNTTYGKVTGEWRLSATVELYGVILAGWLNEPITLSRNVALPDEPVQLSVQDEDDPNEIVDRERFLGVELDAGVVWRPHPNLIVEVKAGYLVTGESFGPDGDDIFGIRPMLAVPF